MASGNTTPVFPFEHIVSADDYVNKTANNLSYYNSIHDSFYANTYGIIYQGGIMTPTVGSTISVTESIVRGGDIPSSLITPQGTDTQLSNSVPTYASIPETTLDVSTFEDNAYYLIAELNLTYDASTHTYTTSSNVTAVLPANRPAVPSGTPPQTYVSLGKFEVAGGIITDIDMSGFLGADRSDAVFTRSIDHSFTNSNVYFYPGTIMPAARNPSIGGVLAYGGWIYIDSGPLTIGSPSSGAQYAEPDGYNLYRVFWKEFSDTLCPVTGGRGTSALADYVANKPIQMFSYTGNLLGASDSGLHPIGVEAISSGGPGYNATFMPYLIKK